MDQTAHSVFISYARDDSDWVTAMVNLLIAGGAKVFMDVRDIAYGDKWEEVLLSKLREVERVLVFWAYAYRRYKPPVRWLAAGSLA